MADILKKRSNHLIFQMLVILTFTQSIFAQTINLDSLSLTVTQENRPLVRIQMIERSLDALTNQDQETFEHFIKKLDYSNLTNLELLLLDSYKTRKLFKSGSYNTVLEQPSVTNPFVQFYKGSAHFIKGNNNRAIETFKSTENTFESYHDSIYLASVYNNIGAIHWHLDNLDSALIYFQKAKKLTFWHNSMLENNILAIANALNDKDLAQFQIRNIISNSNEYDDPYFLVNAIQYYKSHDTIKYDSLLTYVRSSYDYLSQVPIQLLPEYIRQGWMLDSLASVMISQQSNNFFDDALHATLTNEIVADSSFTDSVLQELSIKAINPIDSSLAGIMIKLSNSDRLALSKAINLIESDQRKEMLDKLNYAAKDFQIIVKKKSNQLKMVVISGLIILVISLIVIVMGQRKFIREIKEKARLNLENSALSKKNKAIQGEIDEVRSKIDLLTWNSINRIKKLQKAVESIDDNPRHTKELMNDLDIIATYERGKFRFRIKNLLDSKTTKTIDKLKAKIGERDIIVLKLSIMKFSSKEIGIILGVSPQHVQNVRSKIKTRIEDIFPEGYEKILARIQSELSTL